MTLQQLRYVTSIAETGTLSEAARRFYIAQPSLTASLRELEEELGLTIFRRTNRGAVLTPEAERLLAAYEAYCADVGTYAQGKFEDAFRFYRDQDHRP